MAATHRLTVAAGESGERLDAWVASRVEGLSRARVRSLVEAGAVTVGGEAAGKAARRMREGERVVVRVPDAVRPDDAPLPQDLPLEILHDDPRMIVLAKSAGMAVHPAPGTPDGTLVNALLHRFPDLPGIGGEIRPGIVHRLDKDTTGVMVVAKTDAALGALQAQFKKRTVEKVYLAIVHGVPKREAGVIDTPFGRHPRDRKKFTGRLPERARVRRAVTRWRVVERFGDAASLLEVRLETGRTHQIRVHLSEAGHPILGDAVYGGTRRDGRSPSQAVREAAKAMGHQALHARSLSIDDPETGERLVFEAPLPAEWERALAILRQAT